MEVMNGNSIKFQSNGLSVGSISASAALSKMRLIAETGYDIDLDVSSTRAVNLIGGRLNLTAMDEIVFANSVSNNQTIYPRSANFSLSTSVPNGTFRIVVNTSSGSITGNGATIPAGKACAFIRYNNTWYALIN